ncbi:MAG: hypothetical protein O3B45_08125 [Bacteroidetes bacterium]|nr:hypothetical protein [Bacteroidota bacterium]
MRCEVILLLCIAGLSRPASVRAQFEPCACPSMESRPISLIDDADGLGTGTVHWTCDTLYVLTETVFVNPGDALTIDPGTVIMGRQGLVIDTLTYTLPNGNPSLREDYIFSQEAGSLVISAGASILAEGSSNCPIVFTYEGDPLDGSSGYDVRGMWGGLIVCGHGALNTYDGDDTVEGIEDESGQDRNVYGGGSNPDGSSGVLKFISIRHASTSRGISQFGNGLETNALTLCGVGSLTAIEYIEAVASGDDGIQIFGGTVNVRHLGLAFNQEDGLEYDQGWQGNGQFIFAITDEINGVGETAGDYEGDDYEEFDVDMTFMPYSNPLLYNQTYVGRGDATAIRLHNGAGVRLHNSAFLNFGLGIDFEDEDPCDAWELLLFGETLIENNRFWDIGDSSAISEMILYNEGFVWNGQDEVEAHFLANNNSAMDPGCDFLFASASGFITDPIDLTPTTEAFAVDSSYLPADDWFLPVNYIGAFAPDQTNWLTCWTYMEQLGLFGEWDTPEGVTGGCTYAFACNFNPDATVDDGSCEVESCSGCMWPDALNYDENALWDDGSCILQDINDCPEDINQDGQVTTTDLLMFLSAFGMVCP